MYDLTMTSWCEHVLENGEIVILCVEYIGKNWFLGKIS